MATKGIVSPIAFILCVYLGFVSCKQDSHFSPFSVTIRLPNEPDNLHPIFSQSIYAAQIESLILLPIADHDPESMELMPLLIEALPEPGSIVDDRYPGCRGYTLQFRQEAVWPDGKPVTGEDYLFTCKSVQVTHLNAGAWKAQLGFIQGIDIDENDPKQIMVFIDSNYMLALETLTNWNLYPAHVYDPENILTGFSYADLRRKDITWSAQ